MTVRSLKIQMPLVSNHFIVKSMRTLMNVPRLFNMKRKKYVECVSIPEAHTTAVEFYNVKKR